MKTTLLLLLLTFSLATSADGRVRLNQNRTIDQCDSWAEQVYEYGKLTRLQKGKVLDYVAQYRPDRIRDLDEIHLYAMPWMTGDIRLSVWFARFECYRQAGIVTL